MSHTPRPEPSHSPSIMRQVWDHFGLHPNDRRPERCEQIADELFSHPTFFQGNLQKRFQQAGYELTEGHRAAIESELRIRILSVLRRHQSPRPYEYLRTVRDKVITAYLQRFEDDRAPPWGRRR